MKKRVWSLILILTMLLVNLSACAPAEESASGEPTGSSDGSIQATIAGGSIGGAWAAIGEGIGEVVRRSFPGSQMAYEVGQEAANVALVNQGKVEMGIAHEQYVKMALDGKQPFSEAYENIKVLAVLYSDVVEHIIIKSNSGINSLQDIKDQQYPLKINFNTKDSFMEIVGRLAFEANGITFDDITSWGGSVDYMSMTPSIDLMRDGKIEAYSNVIQYPSSNIVDAASNLDLRLLPLSEEAIAKVNAELGTSTGVIPANTYSFQPEDVPTVSAKVVLFANSSMSDETAYNIVKSINDNLSYFQGIHASLNNASLETLSDVSDESMLHPGALKFYQENK